MFVSLHTEVIGKDQGDANELYAQLWTSFSVTIKEITKDRIIFDALQIHNAEISGRIDQIDDALASINQRFKPDATKLDFAEFSAVLLKVAKGLQNSYRTIRVETNKGARSVEITKIYIPSSLRYRATLRNAAKLEVGSRFIKEPKSAKSFANERPAREKLDNISYSDLRALFNKVVILGDPGGGKSTLCQHLCYDLAKQTSAAILTSSRKIAHG